jgi:hypothetical protein
VAHHPAPLRGLYAGNPKRATERPTTERLLKAFDGLTLYCVRDNDTTWYAEAKLCIQENVRDGKLELVWSYILDFENEANPFEERRTTISKWRQYATVDVEEAAAILQKANSLVGFGLKAKDALHISCAIAGGCEYFVTTDDGILKRGKDIQGIDVLDPASFVREMNL